MSKPTFLDWNDQSAHAAAEIALRRMREGHDYDDAIRQAAREWSAEDYDVRRWVKKMMEPKS